MTSTRVDSTIDSIDSYAIDYGKEIYTAVNVTGLNQVTCANAQQSYSPVLPTEKVIQQNTDTTRSSIFMLKLNVLLDAYKLVQRAYINLS